MPSKDTFHEERPETNSWLTENESSPPTFGTPPGSSLRSALARVASKDDVQAAHVQALARKLGMDAEELAKRIPADTLRRLKFPVMQSEEDGKTVFKHDRGIVRDKLQPLLATDRAHAGIEPGSAPQPRDDSGRFI